MSNLAPWWNGRLADLEALHAEGLSASEIAKRFGPAVTRNMVIGKITRMKWPKPTKQMQSYVATAEPRRSIPGVIQAPRPLSTATAEAPAFRGPINDFPAKGACKFMQDVPGGRQSCGHPGTPYCAVHRKRVYQPTPKMGRIRL